MQETDRGKSLPMQEEGALECMVVWWEEEGEGGTEDEEEPEKGKGMEKSQMRYRQQLQTM